LATAKEGFVVGVIVAAILQFGFIKVVFIQQAIAVWLILALAIYLTYHHLSHRKALLLRPSLDGFVIGFGWVFGLLNLVQTIPPGLIPHS